MRKIIVLSMITLDGVMQAPGGSEEDTSGGFTNGGWTVGYWDDKLSETMGKQMGHPFELLLGRRTYDVFAGACGLQHLIVMQMRRRADVDHVHVVQQRVEVGVNSHVILLR